MPPAHFERVWRLEELDANPGQLNETWVKVDRPGVYFGQCSELCGARHAYMPIAVEVLPEAQFNAWLASLGERAPVKTLAELREWSLDAGVVLGTNPLTPAVTPAR